VRPRQAHNGPGAFVISRACLVRYAKMPLSWENRACLRFIPCQLERHGSGEAYRCPPRIEVSADGTGIICQAGTVLLQTLRVTGLDPGPSRALGGGGYCGRCMTREDHRGPGRRGCAGRGLPGRYRDAALPAGADRPGRLRPGGVPAGHRSGRGYAAGRSGRFAWRGTRPGSGPGSWPGTPRQARAAGWSLLIWTRRW